MRVLALLVMLGCTQMPAEKAQVVCDAYCDCTEPGALPSVHDDCVRQQCLPALPAVSDDCLDCVYAQDQRCPELFDKCNDLCFSAQTPKLGGM
jgi:hypothetical protein